MFARSQATLAFFSNVSEEIFAVVAKQLIKTLTVYAARCSSSGLSSADSG